MTRGDQRGRRPRAASAPPGPDSASITSTRPTSTRPPTILRRSRRLEGDPTTMVDLLNKCMRDEMRATSDRGVRRGRGRRVPRGSLEKSRARAACSRSPGACRASSARTACSTRRWPRRTSWAAPSAWPCADSSRWSRSSSSTTSGRPTTRSATSWPPCAGARTALHAPVVIRTTYGGYIRAGRSTTASPARRCSRNPGCASSAPRTRSMPTACCAPRSAATIRCCSSSTSTCTARPTTRAPTPGPTI